MDWVNLYGNLHTERIDGVYKKINKSFVFCDDKNIDFTYAFLGVSRTPGDPLNRVVIDRSEGSVIHFQFLNTDRSEMKRAWYMCSEIIKGDRSPQRINVTYDIQKTRDDIHTGALTPDINFELVDNSLSKYDYNQDWRFKEIISWFDKYGIGFFEPLDIWNNRVFSDKFIKKMNRRPIPKIVPRWVMILNDIKNKIKNYV